MRSSTYLPTASRASKVLTRWRGMGAILAVAFYSLFFSAHLQFRDTPLYVRDALIFGAETQSIFRSLTAERTADHRQIRAEHPAFTLLHHPAAQFLIHGWQFLGQDLTSARKHGVAMLTCIAGALAVVMIYHSLLWSGLASLRAVLFAVVFGASTCIWIVAPLPEVWIFAGLGVAALLAVSARGQLASPWLHGLVAVYASACFIGNVIPVLLLALARCAQDTYQEERFRPGPLLVALAALTITFGLANLQRTIYPMSSPLPSSLITWRINDATWPANRATTGLVAREVFLSNIVAPNAVASEPDPRFGNRRRVVLDEAHWSRLDLQKGVGAGWFLLLALGFAGLVWRAQLEPYTLATIAILVWGLAALPWYGSPDRLLLLACLWTPAVVVATGLGVERSLEHWPKIRLPVTILLTAFVAAQITRNWMFIQEIVAVVGR